jgi:hypothetical protein
VASLVSSSGVARRGFVLALRRLPATAMRRAYRSQLPQASLREAAILLPTFERFYAGIGDR